MTCDTTSWFKGKVRGFALVAAVVSAASAFESPYGVVAHVSRDEFKDRARTFEAAKKAGLEWIRTDFLWREIEVKRGEWDFTRYDALVDDAVKAGINILPILDYDTAWSRPAWKHLDMWGEFVRRMVTRYKDRLRIWEVWNEQNSSFMWRDHADAGNYTILLKYTYNLIKDIDSSLTVLFGGTAGVPVDFIEGVLKAGGGAYFDAMNIHPYTRPQPPEGVLDAHYENLKSLMYRYGQDEKPIWVTEIGWPTQKVRRDAGIVRASLAVACPGRKTWKAVFAPLPGIGGKLFDNGMLEAYRTAFPEGSSVELATPEELVRLMDADAVDCVIYPAQDFIGSTMESLIAFVARGGVLMQYGGMPMWWPQRILPSGLAVRDTSIPGDSYRRRLRISPEASFSNKQISDSTRLYPAAAAKGFVSSSEVFKGSFFLTGKLLKPGDELIPILVGRDKSGKEIVCAGVYRLGGDMKGSLIFAGLDNGRGTNTDDEQMKFAARSLGISFAEGIEKYMWYELRSKEGDNLYDMEHHFGLLSKDWVEKPVFSSTAEFIRRRPAGSIQLRVPWHSGQKTFYHPQWLRPDGKIAGMVWSICGEALCTLVFDRSGATFADLIGRPVSTVPGSDSCRVRVALEDSPVYFEGARLLRIEVPSTPRPAPVFTENGK